MAMKPGATTFPVYHFGGSIVAHVSDSSHLLSDDGYFLGNIPFVSRPIEMIVVVIAVASAVPVIASRRRHLSDDVGLRRPRLPGQ